MKQQNLKFNNSNYFLIFLFLISLLFLRASNDIGPFIETQYLFNYEFEFLKRGFLGELLRLCFNNLNSVIIYNFSFFFLFLLLLIFFKIFFLDFNKKYNVYKIIFSITVIISPLTLQHFISDIGRQDIINLLLTILTFFLIEKFYKRNFLLATLILFNSAIMLLIHEVSFFLFIPMIFGFWFLKNSHKNTIKIQLISFLIIIFITAIISTEGLSTKFTYKELNNYLLNRYLVPFDIDKIIWVKTDSIKILYRDLFNTYDPNVKHSIIEDTIVNGFTIDALINNSILIVLLSPIFFIVYKLYCDFFRLFNFKTKLFLVTGLSPLLMFLLGYDHMRWWAVLFTNIFIVIFYLCKEKEVFVKVILNNVTKYKRLYFFLILESFILGPVKANSSFDIVYKFIL